MIPLCYGCGWRINERNKQYGPTGIHPSLIGTYLLYRHMPFCHQSCIDRLKDEKKRMNRFNNEYIQASDWNENGRLGEWKKERKINRIRNK